jgi:hypothetical protein
MHQQHLPRLRLPPAHEREEAGEVVQRCCGARLETHVVRQRQGQAGVRRDHVLPAAVRRQHRHPLAGLESAAGRCRAHDTRRVHARDEREGGPDLVAALGVEQIGEGNPRRHHLHHQLGRGIRLWYLDPAQPGRAGQFDYVVRVHGV